MNQFDTALAREQLYAWDQWVVWFLGRRPWPASFMIAALLWVSYWVFAWAAGVYSEIGLDQLPGGPGPDDGADAPALLFGLGPYGWAATVFSLLGGYATTVVSYNLVAQRNESAEAAMMLGLEREQLLSLWDEHMRAGQSTARFVGIAGYLFGLIALVPALPGVMELLGFQGRYKFLPPASMQVAAVWFLAVTPFAFSLIAKYFYLTIDEGRLWSRLRRDTAAPDIFDPKKLQPVTRASMRGAFTWVIGATIGSLFFLSSGIDRFVLLPFFMGIGVVAILNLLVPLFGWHRKIVREKERQMSEVQLVIDRYWLRLKVAEDDEAALSKMGGLLAMEARIQAAREWPIDFSTIGRLAFYLAIPLFSWIGGALMERAVDAAIG
ncbi:hypothetical protein QMT40_002368 [Parvibaculaceae bacterium PLY_AMNH_Bact1]|nr:hypothetical protein QMT40_002368 [Parvibaculaceae bacterium PLY_AMNH_Bact1]